MNKVFVVGGDSWIEKMFLIRGWTLVRSPDEADLLQFTGGEDVDPSFYSEERHARTYSNPKRDAEEAHIFLSYKDKPMAGICRGGQFLNVMCGGAMWQHVDGHALSGTHTATLQTGEKVQVTSTHHQMMRPSEVAERLLWANESSYRQSAIDHNLEYPFNDCEVVRYGNVLCFQPHPEYVSRDHECQELYFKFLRDIL